MSGCYFCDSNAGHEVVSERTMRCKACGGEWIWQSHPVFEFVCPACNAVWYRLSVSYGNLRWMNKGCDCGKGLDNRRKEPMEFGIVLVTLERR